MSILLVTGTSTDVGKTIVTAALAALTPGPVAVCKPVQTGVAPGEAGDLAEVERLAGPVTTRELARYPDPLAPDTAARRAGLPLLELDVLVGALRALDDAHATTIVEGAGGLLVRLGAFTLLDVAVAMRAPVVVVAAAGLGTLNHAELTVAALTARGVDCPGVVVGSWPARPGLAERCNLDDLPLVTGVPLLGVVPGGVGRLGQAEFRVRAGQWLAPSLGGSWARTGAPGT